MCYNQNQMCSLEAMFVPLNLGKLGRAPSKPPWNGIINFLVSGDTFRVNVPAVNAPCNDPYMELPMMGMLLLRLDLHHLSKNQ
jgi:hypothetical protein